MAAAHAPGKVVEELTGEAHAATAEDDELRAAAGGIGSRRPVGGARKCGARLHVGKGMAGGKRRAGCRRGVHQARQLLDRREAPALAITDGQLVAVDLSSLPLEGR